MEAVGNLTGGVAHEFNNLLMVIVGNLEVLHERLAKDDPLRRFISAATRGAVRGAELTQSLLAFSRKQTLNVAPVDLNGALLAMRHLLQRALGDTIKIEYELSEDAWGTIADANMIEAATLNLVLNARDAMANGGTIVVRTYNKAWDAEAAGSFDAEPGEFAVMEVSDAGTGMTAETVAHAFEPFFTTKDVGKGTGLGLSMVYGFAKQSGGFVDIESEVGRGTTVRMYLPRSSEQEVVARNEAPSPRPAKDGKATILVVEDDPDVMNVVTELLSGLGYRIVEAENGEAALARMDEFADLDLLFTDVILKGGMSGVDVVREARRRRPGFKVIFTSGHDLGSMEGLVLDDDEEPVIVRKPYRRTELAEKIAAALEE
jgi:CheY-like chemotaxis protein